MGAADGPAEKRIINKEPSLRVWTCARPRLIHGECRERCNELIHPVCYELSANLVPVNFRHSRFVDGLVNVLLQAEFQRRNIYAAKGEARLSKKDSMDKGCKSAKTLPLQHFF
jgi:hypothetical protein